MNFLTSTHKKTPRLATNITRNFGCTIKGCVQMHRYPGFPARIVTNLFTVNRGAKMAIFQYHPDILNHFPLTAGGVLIAKGFKNRPSSPDVQSLYLTEQKMILAQIGSTPLSELPTLAGWRTAFRAFGVDPTGYRSAAEALLRRLTKKGDIPSINTVVDLCNMVSIRYGLPVAAIDTRQISGTITVRFARGDETFVNLGQAEGDHPAAGEVIFTDEKDTVIARRWCWRQSEESAAREDTTDMIITIEAQNSGGTDTVKVAISDLKTLLSAFVGGEYFEYFLP
jgi:DNA/RNA-binding domain of Phe-tRNA-synthetase-like protein